MQFFFSDEGKFLRGPLVTADFMWESDAKEVFAKQKMELIEVFDLAQLEVRDSIANATRPPPVFYSVPFFSSIMSDPTADAEMGNRDYARLYEAREAVGTIAKELLATASVESGLGPVLNTTSQTPSEILSGSFDARRFQETLLGLAQGGTHIFEPPPRQVVEGVLSLGIEVAATLAQRNVERSLDDLDGFLGRLENALDHQV